MQSHQIHEQLVNLQTADNQLSQADFKGAFATYSEILALSSNKYPKHNIIRARAHIGRGHIQMKTAATMNAALQSYKHALIIDPTTPEGASCLREAYLGCANAYLTLHDTDNAMQFFVLAILFESTSIKAIKFIDQHITHAHPLFAQAKTLIANPNSVETMNACSQYYLQKNNVDHALYFAQRSLNINSSWNDALTTLTKIYLARDQFNEAIIVCNQILESNPENAIAYYNRGMIYHRLNKLDEAITDYNYALTLNPKETKIKIYCILAYLDKKEYNAAALSISQIHSLEFIEVNALTNFKKYIDLLHILGKNYFTDSKFDIAGKVFQFILKFDPQCKRTQESLKIIIDKCVSIGEFHLKHNHLTQALFYLNLALQLDTKNETAYRCRGIVYLQSSHYEKSIFDLNCALDLNYHHTECHYYIGLSYHAIENFEKAIYHLTQSISLDNDATEAQLALNNAKGMRLLQDGKADEAKIYFSETLSKDSKNANAKLGIIKVQHAYLHFAEHYYHLNDFDIAKCIYNKALIINSNCKEAFIGLKNIALKENNASMAHLYSVKSKESRASKLRFHSIFAEYNDTSPAPDPKNYLFKHKMS